MSYYHYKAEDFAADDNFKKWVCEPDSQTSAFWQDFLRENPEKYYAVEEGRRLVLGLQRLPVAVDIEEQAENVWSRIEKSVANSGKVSLPLRRMLAAAAVVLFLGGLAWWRYVPGEREAGGIRPFVHDIEWEEAINNTSDRMEIVLADGSRIVLGEASRLKYQRQFNDSLRVVHLTGEAFFTVHKEADRPFMVYANGLVTKVLGTSFFIQARAKDPNVTVSVKTGRVSVFSEKAKQQHDPEAGGIVLAPNQKAVFERSREVLSKSLVEKPEAVGEVRRDSFAFDAASAHEVFQTLAEVYGVEVLYDEDLFKECRLTIDLTNEDLFQKLEVICKVLDASYKLIDAQVIIYGSGCS